MKSNSPSSDEGALSRSSFSRSRTSRLMKTKHRIYSQNKQLSGCEAKGALSKLRFKEVRERTSRLTSPCPLSILSFSNSSAFSLQFPSTKRITRFLISDSNIRGGMNLMIERRTKESRRDQFDASLFQFDSTKRVRTHLPSNGLSLAPFKAFSNPSPSL